MTPAEIVTRAMDAGAAQKPEELEGAVTLVKDLAPSVVLEIGTMSGGTLRAWCDSAAPGAHLVSIDLPGGEWGGGYADADVPRLEGFAGPGQRVTLIRGDSHQLDVYAKACEALDGRLVDLLFIDGDHTYQGVREDFETYTPLVAPGGLVMFHDVLPHPEVPRCDVDRFWTEIRDSYCHWEFTVEGHERGYGQWGGIGAIEWPT